MIGRMGKQVASERSVLVQREIHSMWLTHSMNMKLSAKINGKREPIMRLHCFGSRPVIQFDRWPANGLRERADDFDGVPDDPNQVQRWL